jgi:predicted DCC family thiol-disulfide oxidoreductase YuxK
VKQAVRSERSPAPHPIILYDGNCGICDRLNQFVLRHDPRGIFLFATLQSPFAQPILARHGATPNELDTVYIVFHHNEHNETLLTRSFAFASVLKQLGGMWWLLGGVGGRIPKPVRDRIYRFVVRRRTRFFGSPTPSFRVMVQDHSRFLDV